MAMDPEQLCKRFDALKSRRSILDSHCEEICDYITPRHQGFTGTRNMGDKRMQKIVDPTGVAAHEMLAAGMHAMATNPATKWFGMRMVEPGFDENEDAKNYLADVSDVLRANMYAPGSELTSALHESYMELGAFGTSIMFIGERDGGGLLFQTRPLAECYVAENHESKIDTVYRKSTMTARQVWQQWGDKSSADVKKKVNEEQKPDDPIEVVHAVFPRDLRDRRKRNRENLAYASVYFETKAKHILEESGFPEFPFAVARWAKRASEEYGYSPAMTALPDVKMLQAMATITLKSAQKIVDPTLLVPDDSIVGPVRSVPGGFIYYRGEREITPLQTGGNIPVSLEMMQDVRQRIRMTFFADLLQVTPDVNMTASEFMQRTGDRMRLMGPVIGRLESELLGPMITRAFGVLSRQGMLPPPPPDLAGREFTIEFVSPIAMAQKATETNAFTQTMGVMAPYIQLTQDPSPLNVFKGADVTKWAWEMYGGDPDLVKTADELQQEEADKAQQQQLASMAQMAQPMAQAAAQGATAVDKMASAQQKGADVSQLFPQQQGAA